MEKYRQLLRHIDGFSRRGENRHSMLSSETLEAIDRKYREDFTRFHDEYYASGFVHEDYRIILENYGVDCSRELEIVDIKGADLPLLISSLTLRIRHLYHDGFIDAWVHDGVRGIYLAILLRLQGIVSKE